MERTHPLSFGVFKPVGHVVLAFPGAPQADAAQRALAEAGFDGDAVQRYSDRQMIEQIDHDLERASPLASVGQEVNLVRAHRALAERGYHWLVVRAGDERARRVAEVARGRGAERAQHYGHFVIEELIERPREWQVGESSARGLDAQTPSGDEAEPAERRRSQPRPDERRGD